MGSGSNRRETATTSVGALKGEVLDALEAAVYLVGLDECIRVWNCAAERILGFSAEEAIGKTVPELGFAPPAEVSAIRNRVEAALERRMPPGAARARAIEILGLRRRRDGTLFPTRAEVSVLRDAEGEPTGVLVMLHDLGGVPNRLDNSRAETMALLTSVGRDAISGATPDELLAMAIHRLSVAFAADYVASWRYDARAGEIRLEAGFGWSGRAPSATPGTPASWLMLPDSPTVFNGGPLKEAVDVSGNGPGTLSGAGIRSGAIVPVPGHGRKAGGIGVYSREPRDFSSSELEVLETVAELIGAARARVRMARVDGELDIARRQASVGALISGVAHDFNNMLSVMLGYTKLMQQSPTDSDLLAEGLTEIQAASQRAIEMSRSLVDLGRPMRTRTEVLAVAPIVAEVVTLLGRTIGETISIELDIDAPDAAVLLASGELDRVIVNLVANARDAMPEGGKVLIRVRIESATRPGQASERVLIEVVDEGTGMTPDVLERAQELSFTTKARGKGSGIGLAAVATIVRAAGGQVDLESEPGQGTKVAVRLPVAARPPPVDSRKPAAETTGGADTGTAGAHNGTR